MTDAERIAEYLKRCGLSDGNWPDCERILRYAGDDFTDESCYGVVKHLATMLSDVRREEREACIAAIDAEQREWAGDHPRSALNCARERIVNRGTQ
jgi:trehalose-6-phosphatase